jgi:DNA helicase-2/ATP-dependent DNA helicase PcrA
MSPRALNKYLRCKLAFYYEEVLKAPLRPSEHSLSGTALHTALQVYFGRIQKLGSLPDKQELLDLFISEMEKVRVFFRNNHFQQRLSTGLYALDQYWVTQIPYWRKRVRLELSLRTVEWEGIRLAGVLDKVEISDEGMLRIVDYKTGAYQPGKVAAPSEEQPFGGDYFRQLYLYKLLLEQSRLFSGSITSGMIDWVEPDRKGVFHKSELVFQATTDQWMRDLVKTTYVAIQSADFSPGCGQPDCSWCRLQQERLLQTPVWQPELELDDSSM